MLEILEKAHKNLLASNQNFHNDHNEFHNDHISNQKTILKKRGTNSNFRKLPETRPYR